MRDCLPLFLQDISVLCKLFIDMNILFTPRFICLMFFYINLIFMHLHAYTVF